MRLGTRISRRLSAAARISDRDGDGKHRSVSRASYHSHADDDSGCCRDFTSTAGTTA
jgi:hypothetical protein